MRYNLPYIITDEFLDAFSARVIIPVVIGIRKTLSYMYDVEKDYPKYAGLCNVASEMFKEQMETYIVAYMGGEDIRVTEVHGMQRHHPRLQSNFWNIEHTWNEVHIRNRVIYVDCTISQFEPYYDGISEYRVATTPPKWFMNDRKSKLLRRLRSKFNRVSWIPVLDGGIRLVGFWTFMTYWVWGGISDFIGKYLCIREREVKME